MNLFASKVECSPALGNYVSVDFSWSFQNTPAVSVSLTHVQVETMFQEPYRGTIQFYATAPTGEMFFVLCERQENCILRKEYLETSLLKKVTVCKIVQIQILSQRGFFYF